MKSAYRKATHPIAEKMKKIDKEAMTEAAVTFEFPRMLGKKLSIVEFHVTKTGNG